MSHNNSFQPFLVTSPCAADWDSMIGDERVRFCTQCQRSVNNVSEMTRKEIRKLIAKSEGHICVRYTQLGPTQPIVSPPVPLQRISKRTSVLVASAFSASLSFATALANGPYLPGVGAHTQSLARATRRLQSPLTGTGRGTIRGQVSDPNGAVITSAYVTIRNKELGVERGTISDGRGEYTFGEVEAGQYDLKIQAQGFSAGEVTDITVRANEESRIDQTLSIEAVQGEVEGKQEVRFVTAGAGVAVLPTQPLVKAANEDDLDAVSQVLVATSDPNVRDQATHLTALECAVRNANREMVQLLLWARAEVNLKDSGGQTVLMMLGDKATSDLVWDLLHAGARINARDAEGDTALIEAAQVNNLEVLRTLLDAGAKVNVSNNEGRTALMAAAGEGLVNNVKALLQAGADLNARDKEGKNALSYAKTNDGGAVIRLLKSYGAVELDPPEEK